jgi:sugar transferase (PEP-CTERM/EpsH1 system associated)
MKPRILFVTHRVPWPPDRGDRIRTWNILRFLAERADVDLACLADERVTEETRTVLERTAARLAIVPHSGHRRYLRGAISALRGRSVTEGMFQSQVLTAKLKQWGRNTSWDGVLASSSGVAQFICPQTVPQATRRWIDLIDVDSQKWLDYRQRSRWPMSLIYGLEGRRLRQLETELPRTHDRLLVVSEAERQLFESFCPANSVQAMSNGVNTRFFAPDDTVEPEPHSCVFVGVMNYLPNVDAVNWFADNVWPDVRSRFPAAVFRIVGKSPTDEVHALASRPGIEVVGPVPDVRPFLHKSSSVVVPLRIARGVQNKVLEAMACGRPVVCSPEPLKRLAIEPGVQLLQAETPQEWTDEISRLFTDADYGTQLGLAAAATVQLQHRWEACLEPMRDLTSRMDVPQTAAAEVTA